MKDDWSSFFTFLGIFIGLTRQKYFLSSRFFSVFRLPEQVVFKGVLHNACMYIQKCLFVLLRIHGSSEWCGSYFIDNSFKMKAELRDTCYFDMDGCLGLFMLCLQLTCMFLEI